MQCRSSAGPCRDLPESSCALVIRDTLLCTSWPPGLCPLARATGLCMALLTIFLFSVCLCFVVSNLRDAIWVAFSINVYCLSAGSVVTWPVPLSAALSTEARCHQACAFLVVVTRPVPLWSPFSQRICFYFQGRVGARPQGLCHKGCVFSSS